MLITVKNKLVESWGWEMSEKCKEFKISWKAKLIGLCLIIINLILICINNRLSWKVIGVIILIFASVTLANLFTIVYQVTDDSLLIKSLFSTQCTKSSEIRNIKLEDNLAYGTLAIVFIEAINMNDTNKGWKKVAIPSFINQYRLLVKEIVDICSNDISVFIDEDVKKLISKNMSNNE